MSTHAVGEGIGHVLRIHLELKPIVELHKTGNVDLWRREFVGLDFAPQRLVDFIEDLIGVTGLGPDRTHSVGERHL